MVMLKPTASYLNPNQQKIRERKNQQKDSGTGVFQ